MTVYVDEVTRLPFKEFGETQARIKLGPWAHLWADSREELAQFAALVGLRERDITMRKKGEISFIYVSPSMREYCLRRGAIEGKIFEWINRKDRK